jgi:hypothetical protein
MSRRFAHCHLVALVVAATTALALAPSASAFPNAPGGGGGCPELTSAVGWDIDHSQLGGLFHYGFKAVLEANFRCGRIVQSPRVITHNYGMTEIKILSQQKSSTEDILRYTVIPHLPWAEWSGLFTGLKELLVKAVGVEAVGAIRSNGSHVLECARAANVYALNKTEWVGGRWVNCTYSPYVFKKS